MQIVISSEKSPSHQNKGEVGKASDAHLEGGSGRRDQEKWMEPRRPLGRLMGGRADASLDVGAGGSKGRKQRNQGWPPSFSLENWLDAVGTGRRSDLGRDSPLGLLWRRRLCDVRARKQCELGRGGGARVGSRHGGGI